MRPVVRIVRIPHNRGGSSAIKDANRKTDRFECIRPEPVHDWSFGSLLGYRLRAISYLAISMIALYGLQTRLWPNNPPPDTTVDHVLERLPVLLSEGTRQERM